VLAGRGFAVVDALGDTVCVVYPKATRDPASRQEAIAVARLIAEVPEMVRLLERVAAPGDGSPWIPPGSVEWEREVRTLLARLGFGRRGAR
jgi:hypothetical protein